MRDGTTMPNTEDEITIIRALAEAGNVPSMRRLAELHELHDQDDTALHWWHKAAAAGDQDATLYLEALAEHGGEATA